MCHNEDSVKSQGEIEAAVCEGLTGFHQEFLGRGPQDIHSHLVGSLLIVRMQGALTAAERQLVQPRRILGGGESLPPEAARQANARNGHPPTGDHSDGGNGRALLKQFRSHIMATGRSRLEQIVNEAAGVRLVSVHHDISTVTGEEVLVFSLESPPACRPRRRST
jgi:uncharacterized protein YbcI